MAGHPTQPCPYGDPTAAPNVAAAAKLVQQSGMAGQQVTVWAENRQPRLEWAENYAATLRGAQRELLRQNPSGLTRDEMAIGHELNGHMAPR